MSDEAALEVYRQRYETFRHLDNVRYQAQNLAVVFVSALIAGLSSGNIKLEWWAFGLSGLVTLLLSPLFVFIYDCSCLFGACVPRCARNFGIR